jgi:hypothetical protein
MTRLEREADHYFPIGWRGYVYCGKSGAQHSVYSPPLSPSLDMTKGAHVEVQNVPILQQPDFRRVTMRCLSLVLAFTGCGDRFCQHQLYCTGHNGILVERHAKFTRSPSRTKQKRLTPIETRRTEAFSYIAISYGAYVGPRDHTSILLLERGADVPR